MTDKVDPTIGVRSVHTVYVDEAQVLNVGNCRDGGVGGRKGKGG